MDLHVSRQVQLGQKALLLLGSLRNQQSRGLKLGSTATQRCKYHNQGALWNCCVSSSRAIVEEFKPPGDARHSNNSSEQQEEEQGSV